MDFFTVHLLGIIIFILIIVWWPNPIMKTREGDQYLITTMLLWEVFIPIYCGLKLWSLIKDFSNTLQFTKRDFLKFIHTILKGDK